MYFFLFVQTICYVKIEEFNIWDSNAVTVTENFVYCTTKFNILQ